MRIRIVTSSTETMFKKFQLVAMVAVNSNGGMVATTAGTAMPPAVAMILAVALIPAVAMIAIAVIIAIDLAHRPNVCNSCSKLHRIVAWTYKLIAG